MRRQWIKNLSQKCHSHSQLPNSVSLLFCYYHTQYITFSWTAASSFPFSGTRLLFWRDQSVTTCFLFPSLQFVWCTMYTFSRSCNLPGSQRFCRQCTSRDEWVNVCIFSTNVENIHTLIYIFHIQYHAFYDMNSTVFLLRPFLQVVVHFPFFAAFQTLHRCCYQRRKFTKAARGPAQIPASTQPSNRSFQQCFHLQKSFDFF